MDDPLRCMCCRDDNNREAPPCDEAPTLHVLHHDTADPAAGSLIREGEYDGQSFCCWAHLAEFAAVEASKVDA